MRHLGLVITLLLTTSVWAAETPAAKAPPAKTDDKSKGPELVHSKSDDPTHIKPEEALLALHPALDKFFPPPADDHLKFGFGVSPVELLRSSTAVELSFFQLHWIHSWLDWELVNAAFNLSFSSDPNAQIRSFTFRTSPKIRITSAISIGPLLGLEFVSFPAVVRELRNNETTFQTQHYEPFSGVGPIWGGEVTETFHWGNFDVRLCQAVYKQNYRSSGTSGDWFYYFKDQALNQDQTPLAPGPVFLFEFSLLY